MVIGMKITRNREAKTLAISQEYYDARSILARFGMAECNPVHTTGVGAESSLNQPHTMLLDSTGIQLYQVLTGSLILLSECTCYEITYAVNRLARDTRKPSKLHMTARKHILRYVRGGMGLVITYKTECFEMTECCNVLTGGSLSTNTAPDRGGAVDC